MAKKQPLAVHIVLETSCLFTDAADKLIRDELSEFVLSTTSHPEMNVTWHLPEIVKAERKHQMKLRADRLLPSLEKVEKLLGHNFAITPELLGERVEAAITQLTECLQHDRVTSVLSGPSTLSIDLRSATSVRAFLIAIRPRCSAGTASLKTTFNRSSRTPSGVNLRSALLAACRASVLSIASRPAR
jgi:hypothetical protein